MASMFNHPEKIYVPNVLGKTILRKNNIADDVKLNNISNAAVYSQASNKIYKIGLKSLHVVSKRIALDDQYATYWQASDGNIFVNSFGDKTRLFVQGGFDSAGTNRTALVELSFLLILATFFEKVYKLRIGQLNPMVDDICTKIRNPKIYKKIFFDGSPLTLDRVKLVCSFLADNPTWVRSHIDQAKFMVDKFKGKKPKEYHKDCLSFAVNKMARIFLNILGRGYDFPLDKWNPTDVWLVYDKNYQRKTEGMKNIGELNDYLRESIENVSGVVGISLKRSGDETEIKYINFEPGWKRPRISRVECHFSRFLEKIMWLNLYGRQGKLLGKIALRTPRCDPNSKVSPEIASNDGAPVRNGRFSLRMFDSLDVSDVRGSPIIYDGDTGDCYVDPNKYCVVFGYYYNELKRRPDLIKFDELYDRFLPGNRNDFNRFISGIILDKKGLYSINDILNSRFQTLKIANKLCELHDKGTLIDYVTAAFYYGSSRSSFSAPHIQLC